MATAFRNSPSPSVPITRGGSSTQTSVQNVQPVASPTRPTSASNTPTFAATLPVRAGEERLLGGALMVFVPAGNFEMGRDATTFSCSSCDAKDLAREIPRQIIYQSAFWIDKFEVTNSQYKKCVDAGKCPPQPLTVSLGDNYPVIGVVYADAKDFCAWASKRLPTDEEWEKAARGTNGNQYPWGNTFQPGWLNSSEGGKGLPEPVGKYLQGASQFGALDLAGNVWELTSSGLARGGSANTNHIDTRSVGRATVTTGDRFKFVGFRCTQ